MEKTIHLQGLGLMPAIPAEEVEPGMTLSWNQNLYCSVVISVEMISDKTMRILEESRDSGQKYLRTLRRKTFVAATWHYK